MKRIVTHQRPDADALVSVWLAQRYLFAGEQVEILFVARSGGKRAVQVIAQADCVVDVSNTCDAARLIFDHKPPAFADRNQTCATRLLWEHLLGSGCTVGHLALLVQVVHEGDSRPPRRPSQQLKQSRAHGLHAHVARSRPLCSNDRQLHEAVRAWLDDYDRRAKAGAENSGDGDTASEAAPCRRGALMARLRPEAQHG